MPTVNLLGINLNCLSYQSMYCLFDEWLSDKDGRSHTLALVNVNCCVSALLDRETMAVFRSVDLAGIDSMPFLRWARILGHREAARFYGPDLLLEIGRTSKQRGYTHFFYGGYPGAPDRLESHLRRQWGSIRVVGKYSPPFRPLTRDEDDRVVAWIDSLRPDFLWVGLGSPKQDVWIAEHRDKIRGSIMIPVGAAFDFFSGRVRQAPRLIRDMGFEWLFRLVHDLRRLWVRYTVYNLIFLAVFGLQLLRIVSFDDQGRVLLLGRRVDGFAFGLVGRGLEHAATSVAGRGTHQRTQSTSRTASRVADRSVEVQGPAW